MPLKTLFLNPPSFENFDGGAGSRWPATREIESYWYPVWLAYPAGMLEGSRLLDAPSHHVSAAETIKIARAYEFLVLFTSTPGFPGDIGLHGPHHYNVNLLVGTLKYTLWRLQERVVGRGPNSPQVPVVPDPNIPGQIDIAPGPTPPAPGPQPGSPP